MKRRRQQLRQERREFKQKFDFRDETQETKQVFTRNRKVL